MNKHLNLVNYFGGKFPHLSWLIPLFPPGNYHFVDIMCGAANVALNINYPLITVNDVNEDIINLFEVLRTNSEAFTKAVYLTPFSREELNKAIEKPRPADTVEWARRYYIKCLLGYGANGSQNDHKGAGFEYRMMPSNFYRVENWNVRLKKLPAVISKLRSFQVDSLDALQLFDKVNQKGSIVYFDPPYTMESRTSGKRYRHEVGENFHHELSAAVKGAECMVAISGYVDPLYDELFPRSEFCQTIGKEHRISVNKTKSRRECLWTNYDPREFNGLILFD